MIIYMVLFFLIVALLIGAATRHFLKRIPLPFTVLLLLIGLGMGGLNRAYGPHGGQAQHGDTIAQTEGLWHKFVDTLSGAITWGGNLDGHLILYVFLPILIFEAGFALDVHTFKKSFLNAFYLAGPGIVSATVMSGLAFWGLVQFLVVMEAFYQNGILKQGHSFGLLPCCLVLLLVRPTQLQLLPC